MWYLPRYEAADVSGVPAALIFNVKEYVLLENERYVTPICLHGLIFYPEEGRKLSRYISALLYSVS
jgi:hypothetical protein